MRPTLGLQEKADEIGRFRAREIARRPAVAPAAAEAEVGRPRGGASARSHAGLRARTGGAEGAARPAGPTPPRWVRPLRAPTLGPGRARPRLSGSPVPSFHPFTVSFLP